MGNMTMTILNHTLGFPRVGLRRELKKAQESYWAGNSTQEELLAVGRELRARHWQQQQQAGVDLVPVGDFAWYDHVLTTSLLLGNVPARHQNQDGSIDLDTLFRIGRGRAPTGEPAAAAEMTKWFNTNYHYMVPEFTQGQQFKLGWTQLLDEVDEALALGHKIKPVLLGPVTYLWLGKVKGEQFDRLSLLNDILPVYQQVLAELAKRGIEWVQIDEPALVLELPNAWLEAFKPAYAALQGQVKLLLTTYFDSIGHNLNTIRELPVQGLHVDLVAGKDDAAALNNALPKEWVLSLGVINGRNVWRADVSSWFERLQPLVGSRQLWIGTSCSLLHSPIDLSVESRLDEEVKSWFAFALQKCAELALLSSALNAPGADKQAKLDAYSAPIRARRQSSRVHNAQVENAWRLSLPKTVNVSALMNNVPRLSAIALICLPGQPRPSAPSRRPPKSAACAWTSSRAVWMVATTAPASANISSRLSPNRNAWGWTCWCTAKPSVTTWWNTSARTWTASCSPKMVGYRATVPAA